MWDGHGHTAVFNMQNQHGPAGQHRDSAQYLILTHNGKEYEKKKMHIGTFV